MPISAELDTNTGHLEIVMAGRLTLGSHQDFLAEIPGLVERVSGVFVDLAGVDYLDSSALGMLLQLRKKAKGVPIDLRVTRDSFTHQVIAEANFDKLFGLHLT